MKVMMRDNGPDKTQDPTQDDATTHFGFETVKTTDKAARVRGVFDSVAGRYDMMNDVMSGGVHRLWKDSLIDSLRPRAGEHLLDVAGGTGDIAFRAMTAAPGLDVTLCDINHEMLKVGKNRANMRGFDQIKVVTGDAQHLPFEDRMFDAYTIAFGIRNVTSMDLALQDAWRVLKYGGRFFCLEFSPAVLPLVRGLYERYSFDIIPRLGQWITGDSDSYAYLVQSIQKFPAPDVFAAKMKNAGFERVAWRTMSAGVVAVHSGWKI